MKSKLGNMLTVRARQLLQMLEDEGFDVVNLAERAGLDPSGPRSDNEKMPLEKLVSLYEEAAELAENDLLGFHFGQTRDARDMGLLGYISVSSPTLLALFENSIRYQRVIGSSMRFDVSRLRKEGIFQWPGAPRTAQQYWEYHTANCLNQVRTATGVQIQAVEVGFTHDRLSGRDEINSYLGCKATWSADRNFVRFKRSDLKRPVQSADTRLLTLLTQSAEQALLSMDKTLSRSLEEIREALVLKTAQGRPTSDAVAKLLAISDRTLSRRLADAGTDFRKLLDETREALARQYLANEEIKIRDVAFLLGFSDPSSFSAACKRWTGKSPSEVRKEVTRAGQ